MPWPPRPTFARLMHQPELIRFEREFLFAPDFLDFLLAKVALGPLPPQNTHTHTTMVFLLVPLEKTNAKRGGSPKKPPPWNNLGVSF